jgi:hypothetical protein
MPQPTLPLLGLPKRLKKWDGARLGKDRHDDPAAAVFKARIIPKRASIMAVEEEGPDVNTIMRRKIRGVKPAVAKIPNNRAKGACKQRISSEKDRNDDDVSGMFWVVIWRTTFSQRASTVCTASLES